MNRSVTNSTPFATIAHINSLFAQTGAEIARLNQTLARVLPTHQTPINAPLLNTVASLPRRSVRPYQRRTFRVPNVKVHFVRSKASRRALSNPARGRRLSVEEQNQALAWLQHGLPVSQIADQLKVTRPTVYNLRDKYLPDLNRNRGGYRHGKRNLTRGRRQTQAPIQPGLVQIEPVTPSQEVNSLQTPVSVNA